MNKLFIIILLLTITSVCSADDWTSDDTVRQTILHGLIIMDWGQTRDIAERCGDGQYYETNKFLGKCPSKGSVDRYFIISNSLHYAAARILSRKYRKYFQYGVIFFTGVVVDRNASLGFSVNF